MSWITRRAYHYWYRHGNPPWIGGPRPELVELVTRGRLRPGRAIDLGCGVGDNAIFLAQRGFEVTGVDFAASAIDRARAKAAEVGVEVNFVVGDLMNLHGVDGPFDVLVDYGTLDDLGPKGRDAYVRNVIPLARPGAQYLLWQFEWRLLWWERVLTTALPFGSMALAPGEAERRFTRWFALERIAGERDTGGWPRGWGCYLMTRNEVLFEE